MARILSATELAAAIDPAELGFNDTSQLIDQSCGWIGQQRAEKAARFGLMLDQPGYNLFILGAAGSGRSSLLFQAMQEVASGRPPAPDLVYLHNFEQPERPLALRLQAGKGSVLRAALETFAANIARDIPRKLDEEGFRLDCERLKKGTRQQVDKNYAVLSEFAASRRFALRREEGRLVFTLLDEQGQPMPEDAVLALSSEQRVNLENAEQELRAEIGKYLESVRPVERELENALLQLRRQAVEPVVEREVAAIRSLLSGQTLDAQKFEHYLALLAADVMNGQDAFSSDQDDDAKTMTQQALSSRYRVNLVVDNRLQNGAPVLRDDDPVFRSLFGGVDYQAENGLLVTDFMHIRAGNLLRAHGGYLMLHLRDLLRDGAVWEKLQRYLRSGRLQIEEPSAGTGALGTTTLEPEPLDIQVKLVLIGTREDYYDLQEADADFARHFRVKVDFAEHFSAGAETRRAVAIFIAQRSHALGLPHFSAGAVARLLLEMQREIDDQRRLSARFGHLEGLLVESAACCKTRGAVLVSAADVAAALAARRERHDYPEQALLDAVADGDLMIRVQGSEVGQINGLTQADLGDYRFGSPVRISARVYAGEEGVVNIDREVEMTGPTHDKGVMILSGWLSATFSRLTPLCLSASLVFEQEYHGVEGDSASVAELYALLSALSGLPLPQGTALTGALNQHGEVMPVGGINEKIEGWFRTCRRLGLDGKQGVIIPARNRSHLVLDQEIQDAVARGEFTVQVIEHVLEGIALLTGVPAGVPDETGHYPEESVLGRVQHGLEDFRKACDESGHPREHDHPK
jgi:predicted ATP-dependent protease